MDDPKIESLLRQAPALKAPPGLLDKLQADIPRSLDHSPIAVTRPWWSAWLPKLAYAAFALVCLTIIADQTRTAARLREENAAVKAALADLPSMRQAHETLLKARRQHDELANLRKASLEVERLRRDVAQREQALAEAAARVNEPPQELPAVPFVVAGEREVDQAVDELRARASSAQCVNHLKQIALAAKVWISDHDGIFPTSLLIMTNELNTPKVLICPSDTRADPNQPPTWAGFLITHVSYELVTPGLPDTTDGRVIFARCPIHGIVATYDGAVHQLGAKGLRNCPPGSTLDFYLKASP
jgi:hypothetical protein